MLCFIPLLELIAYVYHRDVTQNRYIIHPRRKASEPSHIGLWLRSFLARISSRDLRSPQLLTLSMNPFTSPSSLSSIEQLPADMLLHQIASYFTRRGTVAHLLPLSRTLLAKLCPHCFSGYHISTSLGFDGDVKKADRELVTPYRATHYAYLPYINKLDCWYNPEFSRLRPHHADLVHAFSVADHHPSVMRYNATLWHEMSSMLNVLAPSDRTMLNNVCELTLILPNIHLEHAIADINLSHLLSLRYLMIACSPSFRVKSIHEQRVMASLLSSLPDSLVTLHVIGYSSAVSSDCWVSLFTSRIALPHLENVVLEPRLRKRTTREGSSSTFDGLSQAHEAVLHRLGTTVMHATNKPRPIRTLDVALKGLDSLSLDGLVVLRCTIGLRLLSHFEQLSIGSNLGQLRELHITIQETSPSDDSPAVVSCFVCWAAQAYQQHLRMLTITGYECASDDTDYDLHLIVNNKMAHSLSSMPYLQLFALVCRHESEFDDDESFDDPSTMFDEETVLSESTHVHWPSLVGFAATHMSAAQCAFIHCHAPLVIFNSGIRSLPMRSGPPRDLDIKARVNEMICCSDLRSC